MGTGGTTDVSVDVDITGDRTVVTVTGTRDAAVVVASASGEQIYLPPEDFDDPPGAGRGPTDSPYEGASRADDPYRPAPADSPYEGASPTDSPYESAGDRDSSARGDAEGRGADARTLGVESTRDGFRVVHPEPATDLRVLR